MALLPDMQSLGCSNSDLLNPGTPVKTLGYGGVESPPSTCRQVSWKWEQHANGALGFLVGTWRAEKVPLSARGESS